MCQITNFQKYPFSILTTSNHLFDAFDMYYHKLKLSNQLTFELIALN